MLRVTIQMVLLTLSWKDKWDILELYRLWSKEQPGGVPPLPERRIRHNSGISAAGYDRHERCAFLEKGRFRMCKLTGDLFTHPHFVCTGSGSPGTCAPCEYSRRMPGDDCLTCMVTGYRHALPTPLFPSSQDIQRMGGAYPVKEKRQKRVASFATVTGPVRDWMREAAMDLITRCVMLTRSDDRDRLCDLVCAVFCHSGTNVRNFRCFSAAFLRILASRSISPSSSAAFSSLPADLIIYTRHMRQWPTIVGCNQRRITRMEDDVLRHLRTFKWSGRWILRPEDARETYERYATCLFVPPS